MINFTNILQEVLQYDKYTTNYFEDNDIFSYQPTEQEKKEFGKIKAGYIKPTQKATPIKPPKKTYTHCDILIDGIPFKSDVPIALAKHIKAKEELSRTKGSVTFTNYR